MVLRGSNTIYSVKINYRVQKCKSGQVYASSEQPWYCQHFRNRFTLYLQCMPSWNMLRYQHIAPSTLHWPSHLSSPVPEGSGRRVEYRLSRCLQSRSRHTSLWSRSVSVDKWIWIAHQVCDGIKYHFKSEYFDSICDDNNNNNNNTVFI